MFPFPSDFSTHLKKLPSFLSNLKLSSANSISLVTTKPSASTLTHDRPSLPVAQSSQVGPSRYKKKKSENAVFLPNEKMLLNGLRLHIKCDQHLLFSFFVT